MFFKIHPELFDIFEYVCTVSYTHLDVYKRQPEDGTLIPKRVVHSDQVSCMKDYQVSNLFKKIYTYLKYVVYLNMNILNVYVYICRNTYLKYPADEE